MSAFPQGLVASGFYAMVGSAVLTAASWLLASRLGITAGPSPRGSHQSVTPTAGGTGLVVVVSFGFYYVLGAELTFFTLFIPAGLVVALVGLIDDIRPLSATLRLMIHFFSVGVMLVGILGFEFAGSWFLTVGCLFLGVWFVNLFNFMDGIDGIAASEVAFIALVAGVVSILVDNRELALMWIVLGGAALGFLPWNWSPAKIFMGDVSSGFLGFVVATLFFLSVKQGVFSLWTAFILVAPFLCDTTLTLVRRVVRGEAWYEGHRLHAYQWLSRRWSSHSKVTLSLLALNIAVILPAAVFSWAFPSAGPIIAGGVLVVLVAILWIAGSGRAEHSEAC